jgi:hypothetical protein
MSETVAPSVEAALVFACAGCGKSIALTATSTGVQIDNVPQFLRVHAECLRRLAPEQRRIELPD